MEDRNTCAVAMRPRHSLLFLVAALAGFCANGFCETAEVQPILDSYCVRCHGEEKQKGDHRFDQIQFPVKDADTLILAQDMIDQLESGEMPPKKADQPDEATKGKLIEFLRKQAAAFHESARKLADRGTVLRRLNRREYRNTVRDLLHLNLQMFDPTQRFPTDLTSGNFDNIGNTLVTTGFLLEQYLIAADQVIEKALSPETRPEIRTWHFGPPFEQQPELIFAHKKAFQSKFLCIHETINSENHWGEYAPILKFKEGVPYQGRYKIELLLEAKNRNHPYPESEVSIDKDEPMLLGIIPGNLSFGELHNPQPFETVLAKVDIPDGKPQWHTRTVWLDKGFSPRFIYINGPSRARNNQSRLGLKLLKEKGLDNKQFGDHYVAAMTQGKLPHIRIHEIRIKGPLYDEWPPQSRRDILGKAPFTPDRLKSIVTSFAGKAFRRPATTEEIDRLLKVAQRSRAAGRTPYQAMTDSLKAVLCSPGFIYLNEQTRSKEDSRLTGPAMANRLAYFLWSSMPDQALLGKAAEHGIETPENLRIEVNRMLRDPRSAAFYEGFTDTWLDLRDLGGMPPDRGSFRVYYDKNLRPLMLRETRLFTRYLMEKNLSLLNFLNSDFTFANKTLARFYGLPKMKGYVFQKVSLPNKTRGGLLGQASILTVTANGIETSPVTRGVWVLDNILGTPPSPPPASVKPLDPDTRGTKTIREQLAKHRNAASCNECHRKIDPPGFALENFDPIGQWRSRYQGKQVVDASGAFSTGETFHDVVGMKKILLGRKDQFTRALIGKLLTYGTGRRVEAIDRPEINRLLHEVKKNDYRFRDTLLLVIGSPLFQSK